MAAIELVTMALRRIWWLLVLPGTRGLMPQSTRLQRTIIRMTTTKEDTLRSEIQIRNEAPWVVPVTPAADGPTGPVLSEVADAKELGDVGLVVEKAFQAVEDVFFPPEPPKTEKKKKVVILGSGWATASLVKGLSMEDHEVTVISPRMYFLFTPMLCGASVGTVEMRSITEPPRNLNPKVKYFEATASDIDFSQNKVNCEAVICEGAYCEINFFDVDYDQLIIAVGATTNTFGVPGVRDHCLFLRQIQDANALRQNVGNCFERASLPSSSLEDKKRALSFVVVGAGPTGVEFCSELRDFLATDAMKFYPDLLPLVTITLLEATNVVLGAFDATLRDVALEELRTPRISTSATGIVPPVDVRLGAAVTNVNETHVTYKENGNELAVPFGQCVWATGNAPVRVVADAIDALGSLQKDAQSSVRGRLAVDRYLRVLGAPPGTVFGLGDCAAFRDAPLPATAQVAAQQGEYLARLLSSNFDVSRQVPSFEGARNKSLGEFFCEKTPDALVARPFQFLDLGILTYVGDSKALAQLSIGPASVKGAGRLAFALWRSVYLAKQMSLRNRLLIFGDWVRTRLFGRDITRF